MFDFSFGEIVLVAVIAVIALGPKDIPRIAYQIGKWLKQFGYTKYTLERQFDFILSTVYGEINWDQYIKLLKPQGTLAIVGLPPTDVHFPAASLNDYSQRIIRGGFCGSCQQIKDLLNFAAENKIEAEVQEFPISQANEVLDKIRNKEILFKAVIKL